MANTTANTVKVTKRDNFNALAAMVQASEVENKNALLDFINHEIELIDNRKKSNGGMTKTQTANVEIMNTLVTALQEIGRPVTVAELIKEQGAALVDKDGNPLSSSKITALLTKMRQDEEHPDGDGRVIRTMDKKKALYTVAE